MNNYSISYNFSPLTNYFFSKLLSFIILWILNCPVVATASLPETVREAFPSSILPHIHCVEEEGKLIEFDCDFMFKGEYIDNLVQFMNKDYTKSLKKLTLTIDFGKKNYTFFIDSIKELRNLHKIKLDATKNDVGFTGKSIAISPEEFCFLGTLLIFPSFESIEFVNQRILKNKLKKTLSQHHLIQDINNKESLTLKRRIR